MQFEFKDYSIEVKAALDEMAVQWLHTWSNEIASHAKDNCKMEDDAGIQLRKDYRAEVDEVKGEARIGSTLESSYWEEFGTGEYADMSKNGGRAGRKPYWVYVRNQAPDPNRKSNTYSTLAEAEAAAAFLRSKGLDAHATSGRPANYTLEKAFTANRAKAEEDAKQRLRGL